MLTEKRGRDLPQTGEDFERFWDFVGMPWRPFRMLRREPIPMTDVYEKDGQLHIRAELPGMTEKDIEITVSGDMLTISGEKKAEREVKEEDYYRTERRYGRFMRKVAIPGGADPAQATAQFRNGVLEVDIPMGTVEEKKRIEVKTAA
ncbi:MAG TPA: Hsp20/alpha crystallin family protein [Dehalococcoidia bacterium]|nr:Hsp20/alpha crystallin family protein [Dehalococcoidia bacterium]